MAKKKKILKKIAKSKKKVEPVAEVVEVIMPKETPVVSEINSMEMARIKAAQERMGK
jgi:hypothetical protein